MKRDGTLSEACCVCEHGRMAWPAMGPEDVKRCAKWGCAVAPLNTCDAPGRPCSHSPLYQPGSSPNRSTKSSGDTGGSDGTNPGGAG